MIAALIAALFVEPGGVYWGLPDVDPWPLTRDARRYDGPWPVVAHPPCARWSIMGNCRPEYARGDDGGCFAAALEAVRRFGGVLEHPRHSLAWRHFELPRPASAGWSRSLFDPGWACEVDQRRYGHDVSKRTWLYYVGAADPPQLEWGDTRRPGGRPGTVHNIHNKRSRTPAPFRDLLLELARASRVSVAA